MAPTKPMDDDEARDEYVRMQEEANRGTDWDELEIKQWEEAGYGNKNTEDVVPPLDP